MNLDKALEIGVRAHAGQTDRLGGPYILHPLRIMMKMSSEDERVVAILHDVVEDSAVTLEDLAQSGFSRLVLDAVDGLTHRKEEPYEVYIERAAGNALARKIKVADLEDNMEFRRIHGLAEKDNERMIRYQKAYRFLTGRDFS
ncbi:MAG: GTP pyrophosphokinase [bacterium]